MKKLKCYQMSTDSGWIGGEVIVFAYSKKEAIEMVLDELKHPEGYSGSENVGILDINKIPIKPGVAIISDGGY